MKKWKPSVTEIENSHLWGNWNKEISEFPWEYDDSETCYILEGKATVTDDNGNSLSFEKGDMVQFESGLSCTWKIISEIKKKYKFG